MTIKSMIRKMVINDESLVEAGLKASKFTKEIQDYLEETFIILSFVAVKNLSKDLRLSQTFKKLKKLRWRMFILECHLSLENATGKRRSKRVLYHLGQKYRKVLNDLWHLLEAQSIENCDDENLESLEVDYDRLVREYQRIA